MLRQTDARIEVEVAHRHRLLEDVPHTLLRVEQIEIGVERQRRTRKPLRYAYLKFNIGIGVRRLGICRRAGYEIVVFVERKVRPAVELAPETVGVVLLLIWQICDLRTNRDESGDK